MRERIGDASDEGDQQDEGADRPEDRGRRDQESDRDRKLGDRQQRPDDAGERCADAEVADRAARGGEVEQLADARDDEHAREDDPHCKYCGSHGLTGLRFAH